MSTALTQLQDFKNTLQKLELATLLPSHISEEKFQQVTVTAIQKNPKLLELNRASLFNACKDCAKDGLIPDGREAALVPYKGTVHYTPMIQGITKLARNSGEIATIDAQVVYEKDEYDSWTDEKGCHFKHKKARTDRGNPVLTYAYAITKDGAFYFEEIDEQQMKAIEGCSPATNSPWKGAFRDEMKRKSALRRLCKYRLPSSTDIDTAIHRDDDMYEFNEQEQTQEEHPVVEETPKKSRLEEVIDAEVSIPEPDPEPEVIKLKENEIQGVVSDIKAKSDPNGKWTKIWCKINDTMYGTFDKKMGEMFTYSMDNNTPIRIEFDITEKDGKIYRNILTAELIGKAEECEEDLI